ncbi:glycosyltransferase family 2 protein [Aquibacillus rhizosphaerae]|uniref:Glycosyltransferase family 2 protein n=1 Tax=Aquibacillus rhizosphaerae TaxID=3051431 RepID=A0ABT7L7F0_9BACI|nr:glycosyltransferase family 2 protein [Aquibacillus sp. LR5S19]MDL4841793.1 glycosyltransferase family 2 protein [Aquibacillus sp. LR5S19]
MNRTQPHLTIVIPCYNEQEVLNETIDQLTLVLHQLTLEKLLAPSSKLLFVDDGSIDNTWKIIARSSTKNKYVTGLRLARNVGHQTALLAGLERAQKDCDCAISIDADLQDDISVIRDFVEKYQDGYEVVYGVRHSRKTDTYFKRTTAQSFYKLMGKLGINLVYNHADYRLMSCRVLKQLSKYREVNLFLRGIVPMIGFRSTEVLYDRKERYAGETKYPLKKMLSFAFNGLTSFSVAPIRFITMIGFTLFFLSGIAGTYAIIQKLFGVTDAGWTSLMISIWFIGGLQLMGIGIIGEYIGRVFMETKKRPKYAIDVDLYTNKDPLSYLKPKENQTLNAKKVQWKR